MEFSRNKRLRFACLLLILTLDGHFDAQDVKFSTTEKRPRMYMKNGNMNFLAGAGRNISFIAGGKTGTVMFGDVDLRSIPPLGQFRQLNDTVELLRAQMEDKGQHIVRVHDSAASMQISLSKLEDDLLTLRSQLQPILTDQETQKEKSFNKKIKQLQNELSILRLLVTLDDCQVNPCANGGTCIDGINKFYCFCLDRFTGPTCQDDVNECQKYAGTDLGCQNGGTCVNVPDGGGFTCQCPPEWHGARCTTQRDDCKDGGSQLCGAHGTCVTVPPSRLAKKAAYTCICEPGYLVSKDTANPTCVDVDECTATRSPCYPGVQCINIPGSFICTQCPAGYTGNGQQCWDVDECQTGNGGCSTSPQVQCFNTVGSVHCGACPPGYDGDGKVCQKVSACLGNPCHSAATCFETTASLTGFRCQCPAGLVGDGVGASGCQPSQTHPCSTVPCLWGGTCQELSGSVYKCHCPPGYAGSRCEITDPCRENPCRYGGTCRPLPSAPGGFYCLCAFGRTGQVCENEREGCGGIIDQPSGSIVFPAAGGSYAANQTCDWSIVTPAAGMVLNVTFNAFALEHSRQYDPRQRSWFCAYDNVTLYDGPDVHSPQIGSYCGNLGSRSAPDPFILSSGDSMFVRFRSDVTVHSDGFNLSWTSVPSVCSVRVAETEGSFMSPGYPSNYPPNLRCSTQLIGQPGTYYKILVSNAVFDSGDVNCTGDYIAIHDGMRMTDPLIAQRICTSLESPLTLTTSMPYALIYFHSDNQTDEPALAQAGSGELYGFTITYRSLPVDLANCGGRLTAPTGEFTSPNYGTGRYFSGLDCVWVIDVSGSVATGSQTSINLVFIQMDMTGQRSRLVNDCYGDYLEVRNGADEEAPLLGRYCGEDSAVLVPSAGPQLWVRMHTISQFTGTGFQATYGTKCGSAFRAVNGTFQSPNFPNPMGRPTECNFMIYAPPTHEIVLEIIGADLTGGNRSTSNLQCGLNRLSFEGGPPFLQGKSFCNFALPFSIVAQENLTVHFQTDGALTNRGFQAIYRTQDIGCGGVYYRYMGTIKSPKAPDSYGFNLRCKYEISVAPGFGIRLTFKSFHLEYEASCRFDSLSVYDSNEDDDSLQAKLCGTMQPPPVTTFSNRMIIVFKSDHSLSFDGFSATYQAFDLSEDCSRSFHGPSAIVRSPSYPLADVLNVECEYHLLVEPGYQMTLNLSLFMLPCSIGYLEIRNGPDPLSPGIPGIANSRMCDGNSVQWFRSQGNRVYMKYKLTYRQAISWTGMRQLDQRAHPTVSSVLNTGSNATDNGTLEVSKTGPIWQLQLEQLASECGADLEQASGSFASPQFPLSSSASYDCIWRIAVAAGNRVVMTVSSIDLAGGADCGGTTNRFRRLNYLWVMDGPSLASPVLQKLCTSAVGIPSISSASNELTVHYFQSLYNSGSHRGFLAHYSSECKNIRLFGLEGVVESPNYRMPYWSARECEWLITTTIGSRLQLDITYIKIESNGDSECDASFLEIQPIATDRNGHYQKEASDAMMNQTVKICDTSDAAGFNRRYTLGASAAFVRFKANEDSGENHLRMEWYTRGCGGLYKEWNGIFIVTSDKFIEGTEFIECHFRIEAPANKRILLMVTHLNVVSPANQEASCEYRPTFTAESDGYHIFDSYSNISGRAQVSWCANIDGNTTEGKNFTSSANNLFVILRLRTAFAGKGDPDGAYFGANYVFIDTTDGAKCQLALNTSERGNIHSPNFPNSYPSLASCSYLIKVPLGNTVSLSFSHFNMGNLRSECRNVPNLFEAYVAIYAGNSSSGTLIAKFCDNSIPEGGANIRSSSNEMYVEFFGNTEQDGGGEASGGNARGFSANFFAVCGSALLAGDQQLILTLPESYLQKTGFDCEWFVEAERPDQHVHLTFAALALPIKIERIFEGTAVRGYRYACAMNFTVYDGAVATNETVLYARDSQCNSRLQTIMPPMISSGSSLIVQLKNATNAATSRGYGSFLQFHAIYYASTASCGGEFFGWHGAIDSPGYPQGYANSLRCDWVIHVAEGNKVALTFSAMELASLDSKCEDDYLEIREGSSTGNLVGRFCSVKPPTEAVKTTGDMWLRLRTDDEGTAAGFSATYQLEFGSLTITGSSGIIASPDYNLPGAGKSLRTIANRFSQASWSNLRPEDGWSRNGQSRWGITVAQGQVVRVTFLDFHVPVASAVQKCNAYTGVLNVFDGICSSPHYPHYTDSTTGGCTLISSFCGMQKPEPVYSAGNQLTIEFSSIDHTSRQRGFRLLWEAVAPRPNDTSISTEPSIDPVTSTTRLCGGVLWATNEIQNLTSPGWPIGYPNLVDCRWTIASELGFGVSLTLLYVDLEAHPDCRYDYVWLDAENSNRQSFSMRVPFEQDGIMSWRSRLDAPGMFPGSRMVPTTKFCGRTQNLPPVLTRGAAIVTFHTDVSNNFTGFLLQYTQACGADILVARSGTLSSPGYPADYPANSDCQWRIRVRPGRTVKLIVTAFALEDSGNACSKDFVEFKNGFNEWAPQLGNNTRFCGVMQTGNPAEGTNQFETTANEAFVRFRSDATGTASGFQIKFEETGNACGGERILTDIAPLGELHSPGFPGQYLPDTECIWTIVAPRGKRIQIDFNRTVFDIEGRGGTMDCAYDYVELLDGGTLGASNKIGQFCGRLSDSPPQTQFSSGNHLTVRFRSDQSAHGNGFSLNYSIAVCGGTIIASAGVITSPGYPTRYRNNLNCEWLVMVPLGHYVNYSFADLSLMNTRVSSGPQNCSEDFVEVREDNSTGNVLGRYCWLQYATSSVNSMSNVLHIRFKTNNDKVSKGFSLQFASSEDSCGGDYLKEPTGVITSPGYPNVYPPNRRCVWPIKVEFDRRIVLTIEDMDIKPDEINACNADFLKVYNGPALSEFSFLSSYCSNNAQTVPYSTPILSSGNEMTVVFQSDAANAGRGFKASYKSDLPAACGGYVSDSTLYKPPANESMPDFYAHRTYCHWLIENPKPGPSSILLQFFDLHLEDQTTCLYDYVVVYAEDAAGAFLEPQRYCGNLGNFSLLFYHRRVHVVFRSDHSISKSRGFSFSTIFTDCGDVMDSSSAGLVISPGYPNPVVGKLYCAWLISTTDGEMINLKLIDVSVPSACADGQLKILNGNQLDSPSLKQFCAAGGSSFVPDAADENRLVTSGQHAIILANISDASTGFKIKIKYEIQTDGCGRIVSGTNGTLKSPDYPTKNYGKGLNCKYQIMVASGFSINLQFSRRDIRETQDCVEDFLMISDYVDDPSSGGKTWVPGSRECGLLDNPAASLISSKGNRLQLRLVSSPTSKGASGFEANWTAVCGGSYGNPSGYIVSPGYPGGYPPYLNCSYIVNPPAGDNNKVFVVIEFVAFNIERSGFSCPDFVEITELNSGRTIGRFCGGESPEPQTTLGPMLIRFSSDVSKSGSGFQLKYSVTGCGGIFNLTTRENDPESIEFRSPGFPARYHNNLVCTYSIYTEPFYTIDLKFTYMSLEYHSGCQYDYVSVLDGDFNENDNSTTLGTFCGNGIEGNLPRAVLKSTGNMMTVRFVSDRSIASGGFHAVATRTLGDLSLCVFKGVKHGCGNTETTVSLDVSQNKIEPPRYDNGQYVGNLNCLWLLKVPAGDNSIIHLVATKFDLEEPMATTTSAVPVCNDYVEVFDGLVGVGDSLGRYCGRKADNFVNLRSSGGIVSILFHSDNKNASTGFSVSYSLEEPLCGGEFLAGPNPIYLLPPEQQHFGDSEIRCKYVVRINTTDMGGSPRITFKVNAPNGEANCSLYKVEFREHEVQIRGSEVSRKVTCGAKDEAKFVSDSSAVLVGVLFGRLPSGPPALRNATLDKLKAFSISHQILQECNRTIVLDSQGSGGRLSSPNYPDAYPHRSYCIETIRVPPGYKITVYFGFLHLECQAQCRFDYLQISSNTPTDDTRKYCCTDLPPTFTSQAETVFIRFGSDHSTAFGGFDVTYTFSAQGCGGKILADHGVITSPNYPNSYQTARWRCAWSVRVTEGMAIAIAFTHMDIRKTGAECGVNDRVVVQDTDSRGPRIYCGNESPAPFTIVSGSVYVFFMGNTEVANPLQAQQALTADVEGQNEPATGFRMTFQEIPKTQPIVN